MKKFLMLFVLFFSVNAAANETVWVCEKYMMDRINKLGQVANDTFSTAAKNKVVINDEGFFVPAGDTFNHDRYYFWLNHDVDGKAVNGKMAMVKDQNRFIIYLFRDNYTGEKGNDVVGYIAFTDCSIEK